MKPIAISFSLIAMLLIAIAGTPMSILKNKSAYAATGYNYAPSFNATGNNYTDIPNSSSLHLTKFSLGTWFKTSKNYSGNAMIANRGGFGSDSPGKNMNYGLWVDANEKIVGGYEAGNGADLFVISPNSYSDDNWHYCVLTYDGSIIRLYVDGVEVGTKSSTAAPDSAGNQPLRIGANSLKTASNSYNWLYFTGSIDEVRLWNRAITSQEVTDQYESSLFNTSGQVVYKDMNLMLLINDEYYYQLKDAIQNSKSSIHIAMYLVEHTPNNDTTRNNIILNAIADAKKRGVDVKFILGNMVRYPDTDDFLNAEGIPYKTGASHAKFVLIDDRTLFVGTHNLNRQALEFNTEQSIMTTNTAAISEAKTFFDGWWSNGKPNHVTTDLSKNEAFLSNAEYYNGIKSMIQGSTTSIKMDMYLIDYQASNPTFRATVLMDELKKAYDRGVDVKLVVDDDTKKSYPGTITFLKNSGIPFKYDALPSPALDSYKPGLDHSKLVIIDDKVMFVGARNWKNDLSSDRIPDYMTRDSAIITRGLTFFNSEWSTGLTP